MERRLQNSGQQTEIRMLKIFFNIFFRKSFLVKFFRTFPKTPKRNKHYHLLKKIFRVYEKRA